MRMFPDTCDSSAHAQAESPALSAAPPIFPCLPEQRKLNRLDKRHMHSNLLYRSSLCINLQFTPKRWRLREHTVRMRLVRDGIWTASALVLVGLVSACYSQYSHTIYVDPDRDSNSPACLNSPSPSLPCRNLSYAFQYRNSSTQYVLQRGTHYLNSTASDAPFIDLHDIAITGNGSVGTVRVVCFTNAGLAFVSVSSVVFQNVSFFHCSALQNSTSLQNIFNTGTEALSKVQVALYFSNCAHVSMEYVGVENSSNGTGVIMYNTIGINNFTHCSFSNNVNTAPKLVGGGGGGVYIEFSYCLPGSTSCENSTEESLTDHNKDSRYNFSGCIFNNNLATNKDPNGTSTFIFPYRQYHEAFGRGGGLSVFFKGNATGNVITVDNSVFNGNQAVWGAGLFVEFQDNATGNAIVVAGTVFQDNAVFPYVDTAGGAVRIAHYVFNGVGGNDIRLEACNFTNNSAISGGGISFSPAGLQFSTGQLAKVTLTDCSYWNNSARLGLALHLLQFGLIAGPVPRVKIANIFISGSYISHINHALAYEVGGGALYTSGVGVDFVGHATFVQNDGSALIVIRAEASFQSCSANFSENQSFKGGAILLLGSSALSVNESTVMYFHNNTAKWEGGAIYKQYDDRDNMGQDPHCFIRHANPLLSPDDWKSTFNFTDNSDHQGNISIHSTSLYPCVWAGGKTKQNIGSVFCWKKWTYNNSTSINCKPYISSSAGSITYKYSITQFPGIEVKLPIHVLDDLHRRRNIGFHAFSRNTDKAQVSKAFEYIADNTIEFTGIEGESFTLELDSTTQRLWHLEMNVTIKRCPPGFTATGDTSKSVCNCAEEMAVSYNGEVVCDQGNFSAGLSGGHWIGEVENKTLVGNCPPQYCFQSATRKYNILPRSFSELDSHVCGAQKRTGVLCGDCKADYGPAINSRSKQFDCVHCKHVNVAAHTTYYILAVYVPLFILFLALIVFNIKLTAAPANAFILYSQVISSTFDLSADGQIPLELSVNHSQSLLLAYQFPYGIFNLQFFEQLMKPFCLSSRFNTLDVLILDYGVGFFPLVMILFIILCVKVMGCCRGRCHVSQNMPSASPCCGRVCRRLPRIGGSLIPAFASFLLLSYSKFTLTSSYIISHRPLIDEYGHSVDSRVYYAGHYSSESPEYVFRYMIPAIFLLVFLSAFPPLLLLQYPLKWFEIAISKVNCLTKHYPTAKVHIFLDAFQGSFRDRMRFFAGLYFLFRLIIDLSYTLTTTWVEHYLVQEVVCIVFIVLLAIFRPYKPEYRLFNFVDIAVFANLAVITALGLYLYVIPHINPHQIPPRAAFVVQYILVLLPLVCMLAYILWCFVAPCLVSFCLNLKNGEGEREVTNTSLFKSRSSAVNTWSTISSNVRPSTRRKEGDFETSASGIDWDRATHKNTYCPSPTPSPQSERSGAEHRQTGDKRSGDSNDSAKSPLLPNSSTYQTATYGSTTDTTTGSSSTAGSEDGTHQWSSRQGPPLQSLEPLQ